MLVVKGTIVKRTRRVVDLSRSTPPLAMDVNQQIQQLVNQIQNPTQLPSPNQPTSESKSFNKVTYQVVGDDNLLYYVTDVEPDEPYPKHEPVEIPVQVKVFNTRKGVPSYELAVAGGSDGLSEEF